MDTMSTVIAVAIYLIVSWYRERQAVRRDALRSTDIIEMRERINLIEESLKGSPFVTFKLK